MKRSQLQRMIEEEIYSVMQELVVEKSVPEPYNKKEAREMTEDEIEQRDKIGKAMEKDNRVRRHFRKKHGSNWKSYLWAAATNKAIEGNLDEYKKITEDISLYDNEQDEKEFDDHEGEMARAQLMSIHKQAGELFNMIADGEELEGWVQHKLSLAADYINAVYNNMQYEKSNATTLGNGLGAPSDTPLAPAMKTP